MSVQVTRSSNPEEVLVTFSLPGDVHDGAVSVVGSFNHWTAGIHVLEPQADGSRSATVVVQADRDVYFRYLGAGGAWFDDPDAETAGEGSVLRANHLQHAQEPARQETPTPSADPDDEL